MYILFKRTWWADRKETIPKPGRRYYLKGREFATQEEARAACRQLGSQEPGWRLNASGNWRGPRGAAWEFTEKGNI